MRRVLVGVVVSYFEVKDMEVAVHNLSLRHHYLKVNNLKKMAYFKIQNMFLIISLSLLLHTNCLRDNSHELYLCGLHAQATELVSVYTVPF